MPSYGDALAGGIGSGRYEHNGIDRIVFETVKMARKVFTIPNGIS